MVPNIIEINPTELCNRKCSFCARSEDYPNQNLNLDLRGAIIIRKRLEEMDWRGSLKLTGQGEPTLNKKIIRIAQALQSHNWELTTITNGDFLHNIDSKYFKVFEVHVFKRILPKLFLILF